jgi:hypothetical protein
LHSHRSSGLTRGGTRVASGVAVLRITRLNSPGGPVIRLEGRVCGCWVDELRSLAALSTLPVTIDLAWVTFVDRDGAAALGDLARQGVRMTNVPAFVATLLDGEPR